MIKILRSVALGLVFLMTACHPDTESITGPAGLRDVPGWRIFGDTLAIRDTATKRVVQMAFSYRVDAPEGRLQELLLPGVYRVADKRSIRRIGIAVDSASATRFLEIFRSLPWLVGEIVIPVETTPWITTPTSGASMRHQHMSQTGSWGV